MLEGYNTAPLSSSHFTEGLEHGKGRFQYASGDVYEGGYVQGKRHGKGTYRYADGEKFTGIYFEDKRHGKGKFTDSSRKTHVEVYEHGAFVS